MDVGKPKQAVVWLDLKEKQSTVTGRWIPVPLTWNADNNAVPFYQAFPVVALTYCHTKRSTS